MTSTSDTALTSSDSASAATWRDLLHRMEQEFLLRENELELLHAIDVRLLGTDRPSDKTFEFIVNKTRALLGCEHSSISIRRANQLITTYSTSRTDIGQQLNSNSSLIGRTIQSGDPLLIPDVSTPPDGTTYTPIDGWTGDPLRAQVSVPISVNGDPVAVLNAEAASENAFSSTHVQILEAIASQVAIAFQRVQHFKLADMFAEVDQMIFAPGETNVVVADALGRVVDALYTSDGVAVNGAQILFPKGDELLEIAYSTNRDDMGLTVAIERSVCGRALKEQQTITVDDVDHDPDYLRMLGQSIQSEIAVPIMLEKGPVIGVLNVESEMPAAFSGFPRLLIESFADRVRILLAFMKLRTDVTDALEVRQVNDLLVAVGDQAAQLFHELNNVVGALKMNVEILIEDLDAGRLVANEALRSDLTKIHRQSLEALAIPERVTQMLNPDSAIVDVNEVIRQVVRNMNFPGTIQLTLDLDDAAPSLTIMSLDIVVSNLLQNAKDATSQGGTILVRTSLRSGPTLGGGLVEIVVRDSGRGIAAGIMERIFDLNFTTKRAPDEKGTGLGFGLWWVRAFVRRAGGEITARNSREGGAEFTVRLPIASDDLTRQAGGNYRELQ